jgi:cysteine desulfurase
MQEIYLDNNATSPLLPAVWEVMRPFLGDTQGNPASAHRIGRQARRAVEDAREKIAGLLGAFPDEVVFTSGATEANNLALFGFADGQPAHALASPIEHPSVIEPLHQLERRGWRIDWLSVTNIGLVESSVLTSSLCGDTRLVAVMLANHETGVLQPVEAMTAPLPAEVAWHCDAVQAVGKIPVNFHELGVTTLSLSAHKFHGPPGIGALLLRRGRKITPQLWGGPQQQGRRPGTEPVAQVAGMAAALELADTELAQRQEKLMRLRTRFLTILHQEAEPVVLNGPAEGGLPHTLNLSFPGCRAESLLMNFDLAGVACSTGSACSSGSLLPSPVLRAMRVPEAVLHSAMRFSFSALLSEEDVFEAAHRIASVVKRLRQD